MVLNITINKLLPVGGLIKQLNSHVHCSRITNPFPMKKKTLSHFNFVIGFQQGHIFSKAPFTSLLKEFNLTYISPCIYPHYFVKWFQGCGFNSSFCNNTRIINLWYGRKYVSNKKRFPCLHSLIYKQQRGGKIWDIMKTRDEVTGLHNNKKSWILPWFQNSDQYQTFS